MVSEIYNVGDAEKNIFGGKCYFFIFWKKKSAILLKDNTLHNLS